MGTKYSTILVGGDVATYNDGPPSDDGAQTNANLIKYATVTSDLTTPLHSAITRMDGKLLNLVDEGPVSVVSDYTTVVSDYAKTLECTGTITVTLMAPAGNAGHKVGVKNAGAGTITVNAVGGANVDGAASQSLLAGYYGLFRVNAGATAYYTEASFKGWT